MLERTLEPEVMEGSDEASEYDAMDHRDVNQRFADDFLELAHSGGDWLDLGTGTALIPIALCRAAEEARIMATDASISMLEFARYNLELAGMTDRIQLVHADAKQLPFDDGFFDAVLSNSLLHHLADPQPALKESVRVLRPGGWLFIRDLSRPGSDAEVEKLVASYTGGETLTGQQLFRQSLHAALRCEEIARMAAWCGIDPQAVRMTSDRHWTLVWRKP